MDSVRTVGAKPDEAHKLVRSAALAYSFTTLIAGFDCSLGASLARAWNSLSNNTRTAQS